MQTVWSGLHYQFLCHVLKPLFFIKIALKLSYLWKKIQIFQALAAPPPNPQHKASIANFWLRTWQFCTVFNYMRFCSFCFEQFFLARSVANLTMLIRDVCLKLNCYVFEKFYLHYALCDFDSILWHCTKLFICQSIDREQIFDVTFEPPPHLIILRTPLRLAVYFGKILTLGKFCKMELWKKK